MDSVSFYVPGNYALVCEINNGRYTILLVREDP